MQKPVSEANSVLMAQTPSLCGKVSAYPPSHRSTITVLGEHVSSARLTSYSVLLTDPDDAGKCINTADNNVSAHG
jgi:hypothetical protein